MELKGKEVTVIGLGNSGINAAILLKNAGAIVRATDAQDSPVLRKAAKGLESKGISIELGRHSRNFVEEASLVIVSPGVEDSSIAIRCARELGIRIISEMELGFRFCRGRIIGITGTNGKTTVTTLIGQILKNGGKDTVVCGNIGNSLCGEISRIKEDTWVVLEVSSFQLERTEEFKPHISVILNITDDHMDRYTKFSDYFDDKLKIFRNQDGSDYLILNYDAENLRALKDRSRSKTLFYSRLQKTNGSYADGNKIVYSSSGGNKEICKISDINLKGLHNVENILASSLVGMIAGVSEKSICDTIRNFRPLSHRFETVDIIDGIEYIDDSKGTTVDSTKRALESCRAPVVLIAGGKDKNSNYGVVRDIAKTKVRHLVLIGEAKKRIASALGDIVPAHEANDMDEAVEIATGLAGKTGAVLLSPMCSSFDMYSSYKERGDVFKKAVASHKAKVKEDKGLK